MKAKRIKKEQVLKNKTKMLRDIFETEVLSTLDTMRLTSKKTFERDFEANPELRKLAVTLHSYYLLHHNFNYDESPLAQMKILELLGEETSLYEKEQVIKSIRDADSKKLNIFSKDVKSILIEANKLKGTLREIPEEAQIALNNFFANNVNDRVYYKIPKIKSIEEIKDELATHYGLNILVKNGSFHVLNAGDQTLGSFLNSGIKAFNIFIENASKLTPEQFQKIADRLISDKYESFSKRTYLKNEKDMTVKKTLDALFKNEVIYNVFIKELKNRHNHINLKTFINSAIDIKDNFTNAEENLHKFQIKIKKDNKEEEAENIDSNNSFDTIAFSKSPIDIALMSTYKGDFSSCMTAYKDEAQEYIPSEIAFDSIVIYATNRSDVSLKNIKGRVLGRIYISKNKQQFLFKAREEGRYGNTPELVKIAQQILDSDINNNYKVFSGSLPKDTMYHDGWPVTIMDFDKDISTSDFLDCIEVKHQETDNGKIIVDDDISLSKYEHSSLKVLKDISIINGNLDIKNSDKIRDIKYVPEDISGTFTIMANRKLKDLKELKNLEKVGKLHIFANQNLISVQGLKKEFNGSLRIEHNPRLKDFSSMPIKINGDLELIGVPAEILNFLPAEIDGNITIENLNFDKDLEFIWETTMNIEEAESKLNFVGKGKKPKITIKKKRQQQIFQETGKKVKKAVFSTSG